MLAILYLLIAFFVGELICRRLFSSWLSIHRFAASFLIGLLICTWCSYLFALAFYWTDNPLLYGNLVFFSAAAVLLFANYRNLASFQGTEPAVSAGWPDWTFAGVMLVVSSWLAFGTLGVDSDNLKIAAFLLNDFGPNLSIVQSFAVGHNFPTEYPHFIGEPIRYHFLFWFQGGNLEFLSLNIAWAVNLLSALTLAAMLIVFDAFGRIVFLSKAVGRLTASLFFFHGSLSFVPFLISKGSVPAMISASVGATEWIPSIYKYTGEQWGVWSLGTFLAQRHLPAAVGIFFIVLLFVIERARSVENDSDRVPFAPFALCGILMGLLPTWNGAVFVAGFAVIATVVLIRGLSLQILTLLITAAMIAVPQILLLRSGGSRSLGELFRWGYVVDPPTAWNVGEYFLFTFGIKFALALTAAFLLSAFHRKLMFAAFGLVGLAFCTQLSTDVMNNHKFLNVWLFLINGFVAYSIVRLAKLKYVGKMLAGVLLIFIAIGGTIELFRIRNINMVDVPYGSGPLYEWLNNSTSPRDIFLTNNFVNHPILLSGRRIFYGWSYFGWSMGYPTGKRDEIYKRMYTEHDLEVLVRMLRANNIRFVAFDDGLRSGHLAPGLNERVFEASFEKVFEDHGRKYGSIVIYRVP